MFPDGVGIRVEIYQKEDTLYRLLSGRTAVSYNIDKKLDYADTCSKDLPCS